MKMTKALICALSTRAPRTTILIRILAGAVFLSEGIQKFLYSDQLGVGRFVKIGIPAPELMAPFVGIVEIAGGVCLLAGILTRFAALVLFINISVAILSTKIPILLGHAYWLFNLPNLPKYGFWTMAHEARTDFSMFLGSLFLVIVGAGPWSFDAPIARSQESDASGLPRQE